VSNGRDKYRSRENKAKVRQLLMEAWDPIGVRDAPQAQDEYDAYVGKLYVMLMDDGASREIIAAYLYDFATVHMGLSPRPELVANGALAAERLAALRPSFQSH
jgi:hypothetical protein